MKEAEAGAQSAPAGELMGREGNALRRLAWVLTALLTLLASGSGIVFPGLYGGLIEERYLPGAFSQDAMSLGSALVLLVLAWAARDSSPKLEIIALGLLGYLAYAYGILIIERVYNWFYLVYMAIFSIAFWALVYQVAALCRRTVQVHLPKGVRLASASGALLQPLMFYPLWIGVLVPLMAARQKIETIYSVFILDLCFIPAFEPDAHSPGPEQGEPRKLAPRPLRQYAYYWLVCRSVCRSKRPGCSRERHHHDGTEPPR